MSVSSNGASRKKPRDFTSPDHWTLLSSLFRPMCINTDNRVLYVAGIFIIHLL